MTVSIVIAQSYEINAIMVVYVITCPIVPEFMFEKPMSSVDEPNGFVEVCVVTSSVLEKAVRVTVETLSGTATGKKIVLQL